MSTESSESSESPLVGATINDAFCIEDILWDTPSRGRYRGSAPDGSTVLIATCAEQTEPASKLIQRLAFRHSMLAKLFAIGPLDGADQPLDAIVEGEPEGQALSEWPRSVISRADVISMAVGLAEALTDAHDSKITFGGIRPELVYAKQSENRLVLTQVAPRCVGFFLTGRNSRPENLPFQSGFEAADVGLHNQLPTPAGDVQSMAMTIGWLLSGVHPYGDGSPGQQMERMLEAPGGWPTIDDSILRLCEQALIPRAKSRPSAAEFAAAMARIV